MRSDISLLLEIKEQLQQAYNDAADRQLSCNNRPSGHMNGIQEAIKIVDEYFSDHSCSEIPNTFTRSNLQNAAISTINSVLSELRDERESLENESADYSYLNGFDRSIRSISRFLDKIKSLAPLDAVIVPSACEDCNHCVRMLNIDSEGNLSIENVCTSRGEWLTLPEGFVPKTYGSDCECFNDDLPF